MSQCKNCGRQLRSGMCPVCDTGGLSALSATMSDDALVEQASTPTLATLMRRAKDSGAIGPVTVYGASTGGA